ncbi:exported hypothetical protein [Xanthomonas citri pv. citri]|nr:exported hypothetical protein [Xanthomonas citri pv. citri]CEE89555.1 exported hypothetical protein [Xanthomonas citri pv. citri]CEI08861.1 exported hypothetical protein [Xanthomonas citri pv. citri]CEI16523.1 exported hypothetical protein [Xanthomonas citri pv. citri]
MRPVYRWRAWVPWTAQLNVTVMSLTRLGFFAQAALSPSPQLRHNRRDTSLFRARQRAHARLRL